MPRRKRKRKRTLYSKTVNLFLLVLLISYIFSGIMLYMFLDDYLINYNIEQLSNVAKQIEVISNVFLGQPTVNEHLRSIVLERYINSYNKSSGTYIFILDKDGKVLMSAPVINPYDNQQFENNINSGNMPNEIEYKLDNRFGYYYFPKEEQYKNVFETDDILIDQGNYYGLFEDTNQSWLTVSKRLSRVDEGRGKHDYGSVVISSPDPIVYHARTVVLKYFILAMAVTSILSMVVISIFTSKITQPLKMLKESASRVSRGDFSLKLTSTSNDEIGELIDSFNTMVGALENFDKVRNDFISNVSHDLRTPLTTIGGFLQGISDGTIPEEKQEYYMGIIKDEVKRLKSLVENLLEMTRIDQTNIRDKFKVFNINELIRMIIIKNESLILEKNLDLQVEFENDDEYVIGEPGSIERVIMNLLHNAIKFTPEKGLITISTYKFENKAVVQIADTGIGIAEEELKYIWDRFYKTDKSRSVDKSGKGLGLSICKSILNSHNQDIMVESEFGKGTKFTFTLDLA